MNRSLRALAGSLGAAAILGGSLLSAPAANAAELGTASLAGVLTSDGNRFDTNALDYDIVTESVLAVLAAKPGSAVGVLADGSVPVTAFLPNDASFRLLAWDLTGRWYFSEERVLQALVSAVGVDAIESVLLYHVVPGATIDSATALGSDGARLGTALEGASFTVRVLDRTAPVIRLRDNDPDDVNPVLAPRRLDINEGNRQIAHGIWFVLRPADL